MKIAVSMVLLAVLSANGPGANIVAADEPATATHVYELRTYFVVPGRMPAMLKRFREHTVPLFEKHGMTNIGYWTPEGELAETRLIYLLSHKSKDAAAESWKNFRADPVWLKAKGESEADGPIVEKVESVYLNATDFSKLK